MNDFYAILQRELRNFDLEINYFNKHDFEIILLDFDRIIDLLLVLHNSKKLRFKTLVDLFGVDFLGKTEQRFQIIYNLLSIKFNQRVFVKINILEKQKIDSSVTVFPNANWYESEVFDMFGIEFSGHPNLKRLLCDYEFEGFPLRKDFPLTGNVEVYYNEQEKKVKYKPVHLQQNYRNFDFVSPWQGPDDNK